MRRKKRRAMWWVIGVSLVALLGSATLLLLAARTPRFKVSPQVVTVGNSLFGRTIKADRLNIGEAKIVDFGQSPELRPKWRTFGIGLPGNASGWFRLYNGEKALIFLRGGDRAVRIPTRDGYSLFLEPEQPEQFLASLTGRKP